MSGTGKPIGTGSRSVAAKGWGREEWGVICDASVLKLDSKLAQLHE